MDSQEGSPWALGGSSDRRSSGQCRGHRRAIGRTRQSSPRRAGRTGARPGSPWRRRRLQHLEQSRGADQQNSHRPRRDVMKQPHDPPVAGDLRGPSGIYAEGGNAKTRERHGRHLGPRPHHDKRSGNHRLLAYLPRGGAGVTLPLLQHLFILGHVIVTIATRGFPQDAADLRVTPSHVEALREALKFGVKMLNNHGMEHYAIANSRETAPGCRKWPKGPG